MGTCYAYIQLNVGFAESSEFVGLQNNFVG